MACSSAVERLTVNQVVAGSIPAGPACKINSVVECLVYTEVVGGSNPSSCIPNRRTMKNDYRKMQSM